MSENTKLWDNLGRTDPAHTKSFTRGGGFKGTAIKPMWSYRRMTEEFGPCGKGWGIYEPTFQVVPGSDGEVLVYCTVSIWYETPGQMSWGVGGDKVVNKFSSGLKGDDEAFKKAFTDAITNALKMIGVGADVHMGMFDDSKYVNTMKQEFAEEPASGQGNSPQFGDRRTPHVREWHEGEEKREAATKSSAQLKRDGFWPDFERELDECDTLVKLERFKAAWREKAAKDGWNAVFKSAAKDRIEGREKAIMNAMEAAELADVPLSTALRQSLNQHPINAG